jgi:hypothetical protein
MSIEGRYEMVSSDKYDEYLKAVGVGAIKRTLAAATKPSLQFINNGNNSWTQKTFSTFKNFEITFTIGVEFDETTADDRQSKSIITLEGNTLTHTQVIGDLTAITTRSFNGDEMVTTYSAKGVTATRTYKKTPEA